MIMEWSLMFILLKQKYKNDHGGVSHVHFTQTKIQK